MFIQHFSLISLYQVQYKQIHSKLRWKWRQIVTHQLVCQGNAKNISHFMFFHSLTRFFMSLSNILYVTFLSKWDKLHPSYLEAWYYTLFLSPEKRGWHIGIMTLSALSSTASLFWFPINNFWRDASISFKVYRRVKHHKIQVKFEFGVHPQNFDWVMALFDLVFG